MIPRQLWKNYLKKLLEAVELGKVDLKITVSSATPGA